MRQRPLGVEFFCYRQGNQCCAEAIRERDEALEQLTATAEVLTVMSRSAFDLQTVFDALVKSATHLCHASASVIWRPKDDDKYHLAASYGVEPPKSG